MSSIAPTPVPASTWTFTQGFILGQASFLLLILVFVRYVVFSPAEDIDDDSWRRRRTDRLKVGLQAVFSVVVPERIIFVDSMYLEMR